MERIGIDLGSRWIKVSKLGQSPEGFFVEDSTSFDAVGEINEKKYYKALKKNLEDYATEHDIKQMTINVSIAPDIIESTTLNILELPSSDDKVIKKAIRFELAQQDIVENLGDEHYMWEFLNEAAYETEGDSELEDSEVLVATIRKNIIYELAQMRKIKWKIERIDLQHGIVKRFIKGNATVIDFGHAKTRVYTFKEGTLKGFDSLEIGGKHLTSAIQKKLQSHSIEMAEELKHKTPLNYGFLNRDFLSAPLRAASEVSTEMIENLVDEIKRKIRSFELSNGIQNQQIYYTGGAARFKNLATLLADELDENVQPLYKSIESEKGSKPLEEPTRSEEVFDEEDEFSDFLMKDEFSDFIEEPKESPEEEIKDELFIEESEPMDSSENNNEEEVLLRADRGLNSRLFKNIQPEDPELYDISVFTFFGEDEGRVSELNFGKHLKYKLDLNSLFISLLVMAVTIFFGLGIVHNRYDDSIRQLTNEESIQRQSITDLEKESRILSSEKESYEGLIQLVDQLKSQNKWYSSYLFTLPEMTPNGIAIQHMRIQGEQLVIDGYAEDYSNVGFFAMTLEEMGEVEVAEITDIEATDIIISDALDTDQLSRQDGVTKTFKIIVGEETAENSHETDDTSEDDYYEDEYPEDEDAEYEE